MKKLTIIIVFIACSLTCVSNEIKTTNSNNNDTVQVAYPENFIVYEKFMSFYIDEVYIAESPKEMRVDYVIFLNDTVYHWVFPHNKIGGWIIKNHEFILPTEKDLFGFCDKVKRTELYYVHYRLHDGNICDNTKIYKRIIDDKEKLNDIYTKMTKSKVWTNEEFHKMVKQKNKQSK